MSAVTGNTQIYCQVILLVRCPGNVLSCYQAYLLWLVVLCSPTDSMQPDNMCSQPVQQSTSFLYCHFFTVLSFSIFLMIYDLLCFWSKITLPVPTLKCGLTYSSPSLLRLATVIDDRKLARANETITTMGSIFRLNKDYFCQSCEPLWPIYLHPHLCAPSCWVCVWQPCKANSPDVAPHAW